MKEVYKVIIVDDHKMFREGLVFVISQIEGFEVVGDTADGNAFLEMIGQKNADVVLMDIAMPGIDGIALTAIALERYPDLRIIALTMFCDKDYYFEMVQAGVSGYLLKESGKEELANALNTVVSGEKYFSGKLLHGIIVSSGLTGGSLKTICPQGIKLNLIETEILKMICQGFSSLQISEKLSLSLRTIEDHKSDLINKAGVKNLVSLAVFALKNNLV